MDEMLRFPHSTLMVCLDQVPSHFKQIEQVAFSTKSNLKFTSQTPFF